MPTDARDYTGWTCSKSLFPGGNGGLCTGEQQHPEGCTCKAEKKTEMMAGVRRSGARNTWWISGRRDVGTSAGAATASDPAAATSTCSQPQRPGLSGASCHSTL